MPFPVNRPARAEPAALTQPAASSNSAIVEGKSEIGFPLWPLLATLAMQTLSTGAAYSFPAVAPAIARDLGIDGALVGFFISTVYGVGIVSALFSPGFVHRYGAVRVSQAVLLMTLVMLATAAIGSVLSIALGAVLMGFAYGAAAPSSTHLLAPRTPQGSLNLVLSLRQIGVPLGGVLAGLAVPPLTLAFGWRTALLIEIVPILILILLLQIPRVSWDRDRDPGRLIANANLLQPLGLLRKSTAGSGAIRRLALVSFVYSGLQLCFIAFMTVHLTTKAGFSLVHAGQALAVYQIGGVVSRPIWGWIADHWLAARWLLGLQGVIACGAAYLAGQFDGSWTRLGVLVVAAVGGATASGFTGIAYGEWARLGGARRTEATGLGAAIMFSGVLVLPSSMSVIVTARGGYEAAYTIIGLMALVSGVLVAVQREKS
jgi:MFS family permease